MAAEAGPEQGEVPLSFPGARLLIVPGHLLLEAGAALAVVSSAPYGGGSVRARRFFCVEPDREAGRDLLAFIEQRAATQGVLQPFVGMLAHGGVGVVRVVEEERDGIAVLAVALPWAEPGRPVLIVLVDAQLLPGALIDALVSAAEGRAEAMGPHDAAAGVSSGLAVGVTMRGPLRAYAEKASTLASLIRGCAREATAKLLAGAGTALAE
ncbi:MAG: hypothetical protein EXR43_01105 [Dehalococcoidia bacterium]|nr:hypothetical protein [Dehalococcoidia bacterium]